MSKICQFDCGLLIIWFSCVPISVLSAIFFPKTWGYYFADMDSADTFRRPTIFGFGGMQNNPQVSPGVYLPYPPLQRPLHPMTHYGQNIYNQEIEQTKPAQWSPLVANDKNEQTASTQGPSSVAEQQIAPNPNIRPPFLYPQLPNGYPGPRPMLPFRQIPEQIPSEKENSIADQASTESLEDEQINKAGLISNWLLIVVSIVCLVLIVGGVSGFFVWRKRYGSSTINPEAGPSADVTPTAS